ncbi:MAG: 3-alpha,7-alpha,12-alpha-trihydroxy-5-beta-cholest-24-enoyl-CoA hydratase [Candidatus Dadabacteria bacterium]|nr:MAG: 3-alpha,7-alpha,12-alpha-trihydroxy-5-beta-cholest-24-enoyl-CoA hydratase [Candidatus Dadabacteria bacterium]
MPIDVDAVLGKEFPPAKCEWTEKDVILYALGVGVGVGQSPTDPEVLKYTYENGLKALPTFGVIPTFSSMGGLFEIPGFDVNPMMILHGEQYLEILAEEIPVRAKAVTKARVAHIYDKGKGALVIIETTTESEDGKPLFKNEFSIFVRGEGGFGGPSGPPAGNEPPDRAPDATVEYPTLPHQAIIYRLSGDLNPLHIDPQMAAMAGFDRPILHGLCTFGNVGRAVIDAMCDRDPARFRSIKVRFASPVYPGETIVTDIWKESDTDLILRGRVKERDVEVIKNARATIKA